jgi:hypothetical protein
MEIFINRIIYKYNTNEAIHIQKMINDKCNNIDIVYMINKYYDIIYNNISGYIFDAIINNNIELIKILVEKYNVNINIKTESYSTPLMFAAYYGNIDIVKYLYVKGAKKSYKNIYGNNVYFYSNKEIKDYLMNNKKMYIIIFVKEENIEIYPIIEISKRNLIKNIKTNMNKLLHIFIELSKIKNSKIGNKLQEHENFDKYTFNEKIEYLYYILQHFYDDEIYNELNTYDKEKNINIKISKIKNMDKLL